MCGSINGRPAVVISFQIEYNYNTKLHLCNVSGVVISFQIEYIYNAYERL